MDGLPDVQEQRAQQQMEQPQENQQAPSDVQPSQSSNPAQSSQPSQFRASTQPQSICSPSASSSCSPVAATVQDVPAQWYYDPEYRYSVNQLVIRDGEPHKIVRIDASTVPVCYELIRMSTGSKATDRHENLIPMKADPGNRVVAAGGSSGSGSTAAGSKSKASGGQGKLAKTKASAKKKGKQAKKKEPEVAYYPEMDTDCEVCKYHGNTKWFKEHNPSFDLSYRRGKKKHTCGIKTYDKPQLSTLYKSPHFLTDQWYEPEGGVVFCKTSKQKEGLWWELQYAIKEADGERPVQVRFPFSECKSSTNQGKVQEAWSKAKQQKNSLMDEHGDSVVFDKPYYGKAEPDKE